MLIFLLTFRVLFSGQEISEIVEDIKQAKPEWLLIGAAAVFLFVSGESVIIHYMLHVFKQKIRLGKCLKYSFIGFFFSYITPSSSGGQPAQMYYMKKDGVKIGLSTLIMLLITITYKAVLVILGVVLFAWKNDTVVEYADSFVWLLAAGLVLNVAFIILLLIAFFRPAWARKLGIRLVWLLVKLRIVKKERKERYMLKIMRICDTYSMGASYIRENKVTVVKVVIMTLIQRMWLFAVTWIVYRSYGLSGIGFWDITTVQVMIAVAVEMLPLPGAAGITETCFVLGFTDIFGKELVKPALLISRGLSFYSVLIVGGLVTLAAHLLIMRSDKKINAPKD